MVVVNCKCCKKEFEAKPSWLKKGHGVYCSNECSFKSRKQGETVTCAICGKQTYKQRRALERSKSGKFFCGKSCQTVWRNGEYIRDRHPNWKGGTHSYRLDMLKNGPDAICILCKTNDVRILAVHHIDEDRKNNNIENLAWLCHNCHHLVHHHKDERVRFMAAIV